MKYLHPASQALKRVGNGKLNAPCLFNRSNVQSTATPASPPRHFLSIADLTPGELRGLIYKAAWFKSELKKGGHHYSPKTLSGMTVAMMFNKRSTRTRVSTESAVQLLGGHPMFLGKDDIQLGVNETLYDTSKVISSMVSCMVARVGPHSDIEELARHSRVPVINALSDKYHPLQTIADYLTVYEAFRNQKVTLDPARDGDMAIPLKIAWVGDANNVLFDLAIGAVKLGLHIAVATPRGYEIPDDMMKVITDSGSGKITVSEDPLAAVHEAELIVTDTWVSMGQEEEKLKRLKAFEGFQVTTDLATRGKAKEGWKFMHCLPRHPEEVSDEVFYGDRSLVFQEAENRMYAALAALQVFVVERGLILPE